ncbi:MAG: hypothetical protein QOF10_2288 [Kribbellaceae bacterium]|nr:hypothetical protein [Kribbellaceae bacterium]
MGEFVDVTLARVPAGFDFAEPLRQMFAWVEDQGFVEQGRDGELYGTLNGGKPIGTRIRLRGYGAVETSSYAQSWFGDVDDDPSAWLWPFVHTGAEGSMAALWLGVDGVTRIVHLGSGSGSLLTCVLAEDPVDFLRLLAIGYPEICWNGEYTAPPEPWDEHGEVVNAPYRAWVCSTFGVTIPQTAHEIVPEPAEMGDDGTSDPFCRLVNHLTG